MLYFLIVLYIALILFAWLFSDRAIFLPHPSSYRDSPEIIKLKSTGGNLISALYLPNPSAKFTLLVCHGNAEDLGDDHGWLADLRSAGFSVFAYDYQGYGTSQGKPTELGAYDDELAAYEYLTVNRNTTPERIILFGRSLGSGPALHLAARRPATGVILPSPFLSAFRIVTRIPLLPFDKFPNSKEILRVGYPILIIHGEQDTLIGIWHGRKLYELAGQAKQFFAVPGAHHNDLDIVAGPSYPRAIQLFAASLSGG
jgi:fermentation-respiration switch protein FrsA (DUF1100 family)